LMRHLSTSNGHHAERSTSKLTTSDKTSTASHGRSQAKRASFLNRLMNECKDKCEPVAKIMMNNATMTCFHDGAKKAKENNKKKELFWEEYGACSVEANELTKDECDTMVGCGECTLKHPPKVEFPLPKEESEAMVSGTKKACDKRHGSMVKSGGMGCFPGNSIVQLLGRGATRMADLSVGHEVLAEDATGQLAYQKILAFLHIVHPRVGMRFDYLEVTHELGKFTVTRNHLVFVLDALDEHNRIDKRADLLDLDDNLVVYPCATCQFQLSKIVRIRSIDSAQGMFAPLLASGTVLVDNVLASNYAVSERLHSPHCTLHALFFPIRLYHKLGLQHMFATPGKPNEDEEDVLHPWAKFFLIISKAIGL